MKMTAYTTVLLITYFCAVPGIAQETADSSGKSPSSETLVPSAESTCPLDYGDTFNWDTLGALDFLQFLRGKPVGYSVHGHHVDWVKEEDLPDLVDLLDSSEPCANVSLTISSFLDLETSTVGNEAAFLIEGYRKGIYPPGLNSTRPKPERVELLAWWRERESAGTMGSASVLEEGFRPADECGDPKTVSKSYACHWGKVVDVVDGDMLVVDIFEDRVEGALLKPEGAGLVGLITVRLVCVEAPPLADPLGLAARQSLVGRLLGEEITILISPYQEDGAPLYVMVEIAGGHDIDEGVSLIEQGLARYRKLGPYDLDWWLECHYRNAEERARKAKLGIWSLTREVSDLFPRNEVRQHGGDHVLFP